MLLAFDTFCFLFVIINFSITACFLKIVLFCSNFHSKDATSKGCSSENFKKLTLKSLKHNNLEQNIQENGKENSREEMPHKGTILKI